MRLLFIAFVVTLLSACGWLGFPGVYRLDIEQGNIVTQEMTDQLKPGMTRRQVRFILGTPLIEDTFHRDRWDYLYRKSNGKKVLDEYHLIVEFEEDSLVRLSGDLVPAGWGGNTTTP